MKNFLYTKKSALFRKVVSSAVAAIFVLGTILLPSAPIQAQYVSTLPKAGEMILLSPKFEPVLMQGLTLNPNNPLQFNFLVDRGEMQLPEKEFKQESEKLIKYFLSAVTIPDNDSWVNLSPYESDRIIPDLLASTEMGKQMLEQDYLLKQLSASLTNPEKALGKKFWDTVHKRALEKFGTSELPMNTFNKVWIVPEKAVVVEQDGYAFITESRLKVMIAEDYDALQKSLGQKASKSDEVADPKKAQTSAIAALSSQVVKEIIIPELEKEVNEGKNFAPVRQIYSSVILASWYKKTLKDSLLGKVYMDKGKIKGVDIPEKDVKQKVYDQYVDAFKRGVYNLIQEDEDSVSGEVLPRKYFSGGLELARGSSVILDIVKMRLQNLSQQQQDAIQKYVTGFLGIPGEPLTTEINTIREAIIKTASLDENNNGHFELALALAIQLSKNRKDRLAILTVFTGEGTEFRVNENGADNPEIPYIAITKSTTAGWVVSSFDPVTGDSISFRLPRDLNGYLPKLDEAFSNNPGKVHEWFSRLSETLNKFGDPNLAGIYAETLAAAFLSADNFRNYRNDAQIQSLLALIQAIAPEQYASAQKDLKNAKTLSERQEVFNRALQNFLISSTDNLPMAAKILNIKDLPTTIREEQHQWENGMKAIILHHQIGEDKIATNAVLIVLNINAKDPMGSGYSITGESIEKLMASVRTDYTSAAELNTTLSNILTANAPNSIIFGTIDFNYYLAMAQIKKVIPPGAQTLSKNVTDIFNLADNGLFRLNSDQQREKERYTQSPTPENAREYLKSLLSDRTILGAFLKENSFIPPADSQSKSKEIKNSDGDTIRLTTITNADGTLITHIKIISADKSFEGKYFQGDLSNFPFDNLSSENLRSAMKDIQKRTNFTANQQSFLLRIILTVYEKFGLDEFELEPNSPIGIKGSEEITKILELFPDQNIKADENGSWTPSTRRRLIAQFRELGLEPKTRRENLLRAIIDDIRNTAFLDIADILGLDTPAEFKLVNLKEIGTEILASYIPSKNQTELRFIGLKQTITLDGNWLDFDAISDRDKVENVYAWAQEVANKRQQLRNDRNDGILQMQYYRTLQALDKKGAKVQQLAQMLTGGDVTSLPKIIAGRIASGGADIVLPATLIALGLAPSASAAIILTNPLNNAIVEIEIGDDGNATAIFPRTRLIVPTGLFKILEGNPGLMTAQEFSELATIAKESIQSTGEQLGPRKIGLALTLLVDISIREKKRQDATTGGLEPTLTYYRQSESENDKNVIENLTKSLPPKIAGYIEQLFEAIGMPDYSPTTKKDRSEAIKQVITQIFKENIANEIVWALGINTVSDAKPDGKITTRYNFLTDESIIAITPKRTFGDGQTYFYSFQGDWTAPEYRALEADTQRTVAHMEKLFKIISDLADKIPQGQDQIAFQVLDALSTMSPLDFSPEQWGKSNSEISKIGQVFFTDSRLSYISQNIGQFVVANKNGLDTFARTEKLVSLVVEAIKKNPAVLQDLAGILIAPRQETKATVASSANTNKEVGGIDFNPELLDLQIKRNERGVPLPLPMQDIDKINIEGLYPVIINIAPARIENMPFLTGAKPKPETDTLSLAK